MFFSDKPASRQNKRKLLPIKSEFACQIYISCGQKKGRTQSIILKKKCVLLMVLFYETGWWPDKRIFFYLLPVCQKELNSRLEPDIYWSIHWHQTESLYNKQRCFISNAKCTWPVLENTVFYLFVPLKQM